MIILSYSHTFIIQYIFYSYGFLYNIPNILDVCDLNRIGSVTFGMSEFDPRLWLLDPWSKIVSLGNTSIDSGHLQNFRVSLIASGRQPQRALGHSHCKISSERKSINLFEFEETTS
jgi:hypothetical protein